MPVAHVLSEFLVCCETFTVVLQKVMFFVWSGKHEKEMKVCKNGFTVHLNKSLSKKVCSKQYVESILKLVENVHSTHVFELLRKKDALERIAWLFHNMWKEHLRWVDVCSWPYIFSATFLGMSLSKRIMFIKMFICFFDSLFWQETRNITFFSTTHRKQHSTNAQHVSETLFTVWTII